MPLKFFEEKEASKPSGKLRFFDSKLYKAVETATPPLQVARKAIEDPIGTAKIVGQTAGGIMGGPLAAIAAPVAIEGAAQAFDSFRNKKPYDIGAVGQEALVTGASELIPRVAGNLLFGKPRAFNVLQEGAGKELKNAQAKLGELWNVNTDAKPFRDAIDNIFSKVKDTAGGGGSLLRRWKNILSGDRVAVGELIQLEKRLGDFAKFAKEGKDVAIKNTPLNSEIKNLRSLVSKTVDSMAGKAGIKNYAQLSKEVSKAKKITTSPNKPMLEKLGAGGVLGGLTYALTQNPLAAFGVSGGALAASNPAVQQALYTALERSGLGRTATISAADRIRKMLSEQQ
jgi:hypothetical protein